MDIERGLETLINKQKGKQIGVGEIRLDWFAEDCLKEIRRLKSEIARQSETETVGVSSDGFSYDAKPKQYQCHGCRNYFYMPQVPAYCPNCGRRLEGGEGK